MGKFCNCQECIVDRVGERRAIHIAAMKRRPVPRVIGADIVRDDPIYIYRGTDTDFQFMGSRILMVTNDHSKLDKFEQLVRDDLPCLR